MKKMVSVDQEVLGNLFLDYSRLRVALGHFVADPRFTVSVGGNPRLVTQMLARARMTYDDTSAKPKNEPTDEREDNASHSVPNEPSPVVL